MACTGCMYLVGKEATCGMIYACAGAAMVKLDSLKPAKKSKSKLRNEKKEKQAE